MGRQIRSRQILIYEDVQDFEHLNNQIWCDASNCDTCMLRFQCLTTSDDLLEVTFTFEEYDAKLKEILSYKWRLRDGSSEYRNRRF